MRNLSYVSSDPRHSLKANLLVVNREDGYGKSYFLLTPQVAAYCKSQPSLKKFVKVDAHLSLRHE